MLFRSGGQVVASIGLQRHQHHGLLHSEVFADFGQADVLRPLLWERIRNYGRNHGLARLWIRETSQSWRLLGFDPADEEQLAKFPEIFGAADAGPLYTLKVRDDPFAEMTPEQEEVLLKQHLRADTQKMLEQARTFRMFAYVVSVVFMIVLAVCARYLWRYKRGQDGTRPTTRWRF